MSRRLPIGSIALLAVAACGGQSGDISQDPCAGEAAEEQFAFAAATPLGFSGEQLFAALVVDQTVGLVWEDGATSTTTLQLRRDTSAGDAVTHVVPPIDPLTCAHLRMPVVLTLQTDDGLLSEALSGQLIARTVDRASVRIDVANGDLMGRVDLSRFAAPPELWDADNATASIFTQFDSAGSTGAIELRIVIPGEGAAQPPPMPVAVW